MCTTYPLYQFVLLYLTGIDALSLKEDDVTKMLAATTHIGAPNCDFQMEQYIYKQRQDGVFIINLKKVASMKMFEMLVCACHKYAVVCGPNAAVMCIAVFEH